MRDGVPSCGTIEAGPRAGPRVGSRRARAASTSAGGRGRRRRMRRSVTLPSSRLRPPRPVICQIVMPRRRASSAVLVLGEGVVRRGDNESGETGGDARQVDEVQGAVAARAAAKDGEVLSADDGAEDSEGATDRRKGGTAAVMGASFREGPARLPDTSETRCLFDHSPWLFGCGSGRTDPEQDWPDRSRRPGPGRANPVWGESVRLGADRSGSVSWEPGGWCPAAPRPIGEVVRGSCDWRRGR